MKSQFGRDMLYVPGEEMLYVWNATRNGADEFVCYQTVLTHNKKKDHSDHIKCFARVRRLANAQTCQRMNENIPHTRHSTHKILAEDKMKKEAMKEKCQYLKTNFPEAAHRIPNRHIFQHEIVK